MKTGARSSPSTKRSFPAGTTHHRRIGILAWAVIFSRNENAVSPVELNQFSALRSGEEYDSNRLKRCQVVPKVAESCEEKAEE